MKCLGVFNGSGCEDFLSGKNIDEVFGRYVVWVWV